MPDLPTSLTLCTYCPRLCSHSCPVSLAEARETVTPQAKMATFAGLRREAPEPTGTAAALRPDAALPVYACTGCGACTEVCLHRVEPAAALMQGRNLAARSHAGHPALVDLPARHRRRAERAADEVRAAIEPARRQRSSPLGLLPSCHAREPAAEARMALRVLDAVSAPAAVAVLSRGCAGYPLYAAGLFDSFRLHAEIFAREIQDHETLLTTCPGCAWLLRTQYRVHGVPLQPRVQHLSEYLGPVSEQLPLRRRLPRAVYHDPCYLGRHLKVYDEPRAILRRAVEQPEEFLLHHDRAACSGGGGLLPLTSPDTAAAIARERLGELDDDGVPIVTGCARCQRQFRAQGRDALSLLELIDELLGDADAAAPVELPA